MMNSRHSPFLIVGAGRGGTSLIAALLDAHHEVDVVFEWGAEEYLLTAQPGEFHERSRAFRAACNAAAAGSSAPRWGNKVTTEQVAALGSMLTGANEREEHEVLTDFFLGAFGDTQVLAIVREGSSCIASKVQRTGQSPELAAQRWMYSARCVTFLQQYHPSCLVVRFEELVLRPKPAMAAVCSFLGIRFEPEMLYATESLKLLPEYRRAGFEPRTTEPRQLAPEIAALINPALIALGYAPAPVDTAP